MEDLIYILLGIAWIIYAAYRANQKQKKKASAPAQTKAQPQQPTYEKRPKPIETIFREILEDEESLERQYIPEGESYDEIAIKDLELEKRQFSKPKKILETIPTEEGVGSIDYSRMFSGFSTDVIPEETRESSIRDDLDFDLRKAVIYAEILNRPYQ